MEDGLAGQYLCIFLEIGGGVERGLFLFSPLCNLSLLNKCPSLFYVFIDF